MTSSWESGTSWAGSEQALSFGTTAEEYDRVRPDYPVEVVRWALGTGPSQVVDLGAGTGKLTRLLVDEGHEVTAVEPDALMRERLAGTTPGARVLAGTGEELPLPDASADAVLVAQAWHWMDQERASAELARVVRPGGLVVLLWNLRDPHDPLARAVLQVVREIAPDLVQRGTADSSGAAAFARLPDPRFSGDGTRLVPNDVLYPVADFVALVRTWSYVALAPQRDGLLAAIQAAARDLAAPDGTVTLVQRAHAHRFRRTAG